MATLVIALLLSACGSAPEPVISASPAPSLQESAEPLTMTVRKVADGLTAPLAIITPPGQPERRLVLDQIGTVRQLTDAGMSAGPPFLDLRQQIVSLNTDRDDERGLLGLAFHPDFEANHRLAVFRTAPSGKRSVSHRNVLSEYQTDPAGGRVDPSTEKVLWSQDQQEPSHAAGQLHFDDQGRLLLFLGDGQELTAQDPTSLMGKVLRFDLRRPGAEPEVVASGLRHPWRISYDAPTRQLLIAEPNFTSRSQEVNSLVDGANYGWPLAVPPRCWGAAGTMPQPACISLDGTSLQPPVAEYGPELGLIVAGAHVYRGDRLAALQGRLVAVDWGVTRSGTRGGGRVLYSERVEQPPYRFQEAEVEGLPFPTPWFWSLGRDHAGDLYLMTMNTKSVQPEEGAIYRIHAAG